MLMDLDAISKGKHTRKEQDQYPAVLTIQAWSVKDYGKEQYFPAGQSEKSQASLVDRVILPTRIASHCAGLICRAFISVHLECTQS